MINYLLVLIGILTAFKISLIGELLASELLIVFLFVINFRSILKFNFSSKASINVILFCALYFIGQVLTDLYMDTTYVDYIRGWSKILIFLINFCTLSFLFKWRLRLYIIFGLGVIIGQIVSILYFPNNYNVLWKFGWGPTLTFFIVLVLSKYLYLNFWYKGAIIIILSFLHFFMNARSLGGITLLTGIFVLFPSSFTNRIDVKNFFNFRQISLFGVLLYGVLSFYSFLANNDYLGSDAKEKYLMQTKNGENILSGGRGEYLASIPAILDSPILGHGSWAKNPKYIKHYLTVRGEDYTSPKYFEMLNRGLIPTHSHLLGGWVEAGILGFIFWFIIFRLSLKSFLFCAKENYLKYFPFIGFVLLTFLWDLVFSPFGLDRRILDPYFIIIALSFVRGKINLMVNK